MVRRANDAALITSFDRCRVVNTVSPSPIVILRLAKTGDTDEAVAPPSRTTVALDSRDDDERRREMDCVCVLLYVLVS